MGKNSTEGSPAPHPGTREAEEVPRGTGEYGEEAVQCLRGSFSDNFLGSLIRGMHDIQRVTDWLIVEQADGGKDREMIVGWLHARRDQINAYREDGTQPDLDGKWSGVSQPDDWRAARESVRSDYPEWDEKEAVEHPDHWHQRAYEAGANIKPPSKKDEEEAEKAVAGGGGDE